MHPINPTQLPRNFFLEIGKGKVEGAREVEVEGGNIIRAKYLWNGNCQISLSLKVKNSFNKPNLVDPSPRQNPVEGVH